MGFCAMNDARKPPQGASVPSHAAGTGAGGQLPLLPGQTDRDRDALMPLPEAAVSRAAPKGTGRPLGARNRRTDLMAQYLVDRYGDPLEGHVALGMMDLRTLVRELKIISSDCGIKLELSVGALLNLQARLRAEALPFIHAKRAQETAQGDPVLPMIGIGRADNVHVHGAVPAGVSIEDRLDAMKEIEGNQIDSEVPPEKSHGGKSHDDENP